jgi:myosin heavy subunit
LLLLLLLLLLTSDPLLQALQLFVDDEQTDQIFRALIAILALGNVQVNIDADATDE